MLINKIFSPIWIANLFTIYGGGGGGGKGIGDVLGLGAATLLGPEILPALGATDIGAAAAAPIMGADLSAASAFAPAVEGGLSAGILPAATDITSGIGSITSGLGGLGSTLDAAGAAAPGIMGGDLSAAGAFGPSATTTPSGFVDTTTGVSGAGTGGAGGAPSAVATPAPTPSFLGDTGNILNTAQRGLSAINTAQNIKQGNIPGAALGILGTLPASATAPISPTSAGFDGSSAISNGMPSVADTGGVISESAFGPTTGGGLDQGIIPPSPTNETGLTAPSAGYGATIPVGPTSSATPGILDQIKSAITNDPLGTALKAGSLGMGAYSAIQGPKMAQEYMQKMTDQMKALGLPASQVGQQLINQYQSGQLSANDQYQIDQWRNNAKAQMQQYFSQAGLSSSSMAQQAMQQIDQQAQAMQSQALQNTLNSGLNALQVGSAPVQNAIKAQIQGDAAAQQQQSAFLQQLAKMDASSGTSA